MEKLDTVIGVFYDVPMGSGEQGDDGEEDEAEAPPELVALLEERAMVLCPHLKYHFLMLPIFTIFTSCCTRGRNLVFHGRLY